MKKKTWDNPNKMHFESLHKTFNRHAKCINTGNVIGGEQLSGCIRAYNETECNNNLFPPGHLQNYDLNWLNKHLPVSLKDWIKKQDKNQKLIGYTFFYWKGKKRIFIGWVITDSEYNHLITEYARNTEKAVSAIEECKKYICNGKE